MKSIIQLTALALIAASSGVRAIDLPFTLRGSSADHEDAQATGLIEDGEEAELSNTCGMHCTKKNDCWKGGVVQCGTCDLKYAGTQFYGKCIADMCNSHCESDDDCDVGDGYNYCRTCDLQYAGTRTYKTCVSTQPAPTPAPSEPYNPFPRGGACKKSCRKDKDCGVGGYNPCGKCGSMSGTRTHHRCYAPELAEE